MQLFLLRQLWLEDGLPLRDLGLRDQLDATSTAWLVDQLERAGMVERKRNRTEATLLERKLSDLIHAAYGLTPDEIALLWATAPPQMPL